LTGIDSIENKFVNLVKSVRMRVENTLS